MFPRFSNGAVTQDSDATTAEPTNTTSVEDRVELRKKLVVLKTLARGLLKTAYLDTFNVHSKSRPNLSVGIQQTVPKKLLSLELKHILTEIDGLKDALQHNHASEANNERSPSAPHTLENLVAALNPDETSKEANLAPIERDDKFPWPIKGEIFSAPGSAFREGGAKWPGILITTQASTDVYSIAPGKVVYAGKMKNLGLLVIIDHEDGHLSLYGRNSKILVSQDERVGKHQKISSVAKLSSNNNSGLYFEIRRHGKPVDPRRLCAELVPPN